MKRIYTFLFAMTALAGTVSAQRNVDLSIRHFYKLGTTTPTAANEIKNGTRILFDGDETYKINFGYAIRNNAANAADSVISSDTIKFRTTLDGGQFINFSDFDFHIPGGNEYGIFGLSSYPQAIAPAPEAFDNISKALESRLCDSIWIVSAAGSMNPAVETNKANDTTCHNILIDGWMTSINDIEVDLEGNGLLVYPNPTASRDINIMYNFGKNTNHATVTIMDITGRVVYSKNIGTNLSGTQSIALQMGNIAPGMYSVRLATDTKTTIEKIYVK